MMTRRWPGWVAAGVLMCATGAAATPATRAAAATHLSPAEQRMVTYIDAHNAEALALLERVVNINSGTQNLAGVREVGDIFRARFDALGFRTRWVDGAPFHRAGHLVADHPGPGPRIVLVGHLDTVFAKDGPFQKFQRLDANTATGPGVIDMKGGDVIALQALAALRDAGLLDRLNLIVVFDGDEEEPGSPLATTRATLIDAAKGAYAAIGFEDADGNPHNAVIARRGDSSWHLKVTGTTAHSSQIFQPAVGAGAVFEAARILEAFRQKLAGQAHLTFNPGLIVGGTQASVDDPQARGTAFGQTNVVADLALVNGDIRTLSKDQLEQDEQTMKEIVAASLPHTQATMTFDDGYPPLAPTDGNRKLLAMYSQASEDLGQGPVNPVDPDKAGAADVSFLAGEVGMIIDGAGLKGHGDHSPDETADLTWLPAQTKRAALLLERLSHP